MLEILLSFAISFLIGLMIGIEREHSHAEGVQAIGIRTFILFSLLGTLTATLNQLALTITISFFVFCIILLGYFRSTVKTGKKIDVGITTEIAAGLIFCLGYMVPSENLIAITISALVLLVLIERKRLHILAKKKFKPHEMEAAIILIIFTLGILPILPNRTIDPWELFNPRNFGILMASIAAIQFSGYIVIRLFGERFGLAMTGFLGGFISSTAVFANLAHTLRSHSNLVQAIIASGILATTAMLIEIATIVCIASPTLLLFIIKPIIMMIVLSLIFAIFLLRSQTIEKHSISSVSNPLNLLSIVRTSLFIALTLVLIAITKRFIGTKGVILISFLGGLFEIHGISLATALLYLSHNLTISYARLVLYTAITASFVSKIFLLWSLTPARFALQTSIFLFAILFSGGAIYWFTQ